MLSMQMTIIVGVKPNLLLSLLLNRSKGSSRRKTSLKDQKDLKLRSVFRSEPFMGKLFSVH